MKKNLSRLSLILIALILISVMGFFYQEKKLHPSTDANASNHQAKNISLSDNWIGEPTSGFRKLKAISAEKYMISSANELASEAGAEILAKGGNAVDAIIAAQLVLNVVEPHSSGIGGGGFLLYYDAKSGKTLYFNGRETAPAKAHSRMFLNPEGKPREFSDAVRGGLSVGVPGLLKVLRNAHQHHGKLPWKELFQPAIKIAREGFPVTERFHVLSSHIGYLKDFGETAEIYLKNGRPYRVGENITNEKFANTSNKNMIIDRT